MFKSIVTLALLMGVPLFAQESLVVGTNAEYAPFTYIDQNRIVGFDIDVAQEVCTRLGKTMQLKDMPFDALIPDVTLGNVAFVAAGMCATDERAKRVLFTKPYMSGDPLIILTKEKPCSLAELTGKKVVVNEGYTADLYASKLDGIDLVRLNSAVDAFLALKSGRVDAFITAKNSVSPILAAQKENAFAWTGIPNTSESCSLAVSKKHPELLEQIQGALDSMVQDGTMDKLKTKWKLK